MTGPRRRRRAGRESPIPPPMLHILLSLAEAPAHGYALKQAIEERTERRVKMGAGTLYETIQRLEARGWIEETEDDDDGGQRPRRTYAITPEGRSTLVRELQAMEAVLRRARRLDLIPAPTEA